MGNPVAAGVHAGPPHQATEERRRKMLRKERKRLGAALILAAALALTLAVPAGAADLSGWREARELMADGFLSRVLGWLGLAPAPGIRKCDQGASIEPNGCPKSDGERGASIDPDGLQAGAPPAGERGLSIDPDGSH